MLYLWLKALHVAAMATWMAGMFILALAMTIFATAPRPRAAQEQRILGVLHAWNRRVTSPAMVLAWALGITLTVLGSWLPAAWLIAKLVLIFALSALHGILSGALRRMGTIPDYAPRRFLLHSAPVLLLSLLAIAILAVVKPF